MKKIIFPLFLLLAFTACDEENYEVETTAPEALKLVARNLILQVGQTERLGEDGATITLTGIPEDSRCPTNVECFWAGRVIAEFKLEKDRQIVVKKLTDNPVGDPNLSTSFEAFGYSVTLVEVRPYPVDGNTPIEQKEYRVEISVDHAKPGIGEEK